MNIEKRNEKLLDKGSFFVFYIERNRKEVSWCLYVKNKKSKYLDIK